MSNANILIVEDEVLVSESIETTLRRLDYRIAGVLVFGEELLRRFAGLSPDLILMDIGLQGGREGIEAAELISSRHDIPIVYLTAHVSESLLERVKPTALFGYVLKPFTEKELQVAIEMALYRHGLETKIRKLNDKLEQQVEERTMALQKANLNLQQTIDVFQSAMSQLAQAEKMAGLGGLVAGMTHEMSNPVGISVMALSHLDEHTQEVTKKFNAQQLSRQDFEKYLQIAVESVAILDKNLSQTTELLNSFKQIAIDQSSDRKRVFNLSTYLEEIILSLRPTLKSTQHTIDIECPASVTLYSYPGAFSQIVTNFVLNSLIHGFDGVQAGRINIRADMNDEVFSFYYEDDGCGVPEEYLDKLFDLFFTSKREQGSSGLGLHIVHNLVTQTFGGAINCKSGPGRGAKFTIRIPAPALKKI